jgi:hypothetical protein
MKNVAFEMWGHVGLVGTYISEKPFAYNCIVGIIRELKSRFTVNLLVPANVVPS